ELSDVNKRHRMRARPKVLLCHSYEEAIELFQRYQEYVIAVISDMCYSREGKLDEEAGLNLFRLLQQQESQPAMLLQSSEAGNSRKAAEMGVAFLNKNSATLIHGLRQFIIRKLGFGPFVFRNRFGEEITRAYSINDFEHKLKLVNENTILYHSKRDDFSHWLTAHGEFMVAKRVRELKIKDFHSTYEIQKYLIDTFVNVRNLRNRGKILNFTPDVIEQHDCVIRLAEGSLGGKGRGLFFLNALLVSMEFDESFPEVYIRIPTTFVIGTEEFDRFIRNVRLPEKLDDCNDAEIKKLFLETNLSDELTQKLKLVLRMIKKPLAIRSSGLLEDSQSQPFAGVYQTYMLPNCHPDEHFRLKQLLQAIKLVYASVFLSSARQYIESISYKLEDEKMAVIIQEVVGQVHDGFYYPHISGVAQSYNYYCIEGFENTDGIATIAVGLGKTVVDGEKAFRFIPPKPRKDILPFEELSSNAQKKLYAIPLCENDFDLSEGEDASLTKLPVRNIVKHGTLKNIASTWDYRNNRMVDNLKADGPKVITFANILKRGVFPLAEIITEVLDIGQTAMGLPVEIEFAVDLTSKPGTDNRPNFYMLQIRPLTINEGECSIDIEKLNRQDLLLYTEHSMGNGFIEDITDIVYIPPEQYDSTKTLEMMDEISRINEILKHCKRKYVLIGPGRWGSKDRFLGVPVKWAQINNVAIVIEVTRKDYKVDSSQGTHFFHNLISRNVGYFSIAHDSATDFINWEKIDALPSEGEYTFARHVILQQPVSAVLDGRTGQAVIKLRQD
ncbi:MAG: PEP/pyruvate-binding domain-containing protein, partial [Candidatus Cloacimonetes bacterium]|nr:PEP/pyruvate-binding domain-containing protein [Candidatus Cloacimonadota bacterium]